MFAGRLPQSPASAAPSNGRSYAYISNFVSNSVSVFDTTDPSAAVPGSPISVGSGPIGLAVSPRGGELYVAINSTDSVAIIDTATNTVSGSIGVGDHPVGVTFTPNGRKAYVSNQGDDTLSVIDVATGTVTETVALGQTPGEMMGITPDGSRAFVANQSANTTSVIRTSDDTVLQTVATGQQPTEVAIGTVQRDDDSCGCGR
ncbi:beta-propeller fold lactonase family protein [Streptomyces sp. NPDC086787]|uniref:beta-propeller fold lactonase family protein n=1 Tax=Streptomyces sp. NPDC086787 TaxID=3365759 RepID=UPI003828CD06